MDYALIRERVLQEVDKHKKEQQQNQGVTGNEAIVDIVKEGLKFEKIQDTKTICLLKDNIQDRIKCAICQYQMNEPMRNTHCGHRFCKECFNRQARENKNCPLCKSGVKTTRSAMKDQVFENVVNKVISDKFEYENLLAMTREKFLNLNNDNATSEKEDQIWFCTDIHSSLLNEIKEDNMQNILMKDLNGKFFLGNGDSSMLHLKIMIQEQFDKKLSVKLNFDAISAKFSNQSEVNKTIDDSKKLSEYWKSMKLNFKNICETNVPILMFSQSNTETISKRKRDEDNVDNNNAQNDTIDMND